MTESQQKPLRHLRTTFREYVTHWAVAGAIVATTGFAPDHWVAHILHDIPSGWRKAFPSEIDYRLIVVCIGVLMIVADVVLRNRRRLKLEVPTTTSSPLVEAQPDTVVQIPQTDRQSIAVLPFKNLSNDPEQAYFAEGLTVSLTTDLSRISGLFVIASTTTAILAGRIMETRQIGRDLGVRYVLQGSVQIGSDQLRVNVQLMDAATGVQLWSDRFDGREADVFALQDQITARIANSIGRKITAMAASDAEKRGANPQAIDFLIRGIALEGKPSSIENAIERETLFRKTLALDPNNSNAWAHLGRAILGQPVSFGSALTVEEKIKKLEEGRAAVEKALALDPMNAQAHYAEGLLYRVLGNHAESLRANEVAITIDRNFTPAYTYIGVAQILLGEPEKAISWNEQAMRLDPLGPQLSQQQTNLGRAYFLQQRSDLAIDWLLKCVKSNPMRPQGRAALAAAYAQKGDDDSAKQVVEDLLRDWPNFKISDCLDPPGPFSPEAYRKLYEQVYLPNARRAGIPE
jgi:adenylate cyclase